MLPRRRGVGVPGEAEPLIKARCRLDARGTARLLLLPVDGRDMGVDSALLGMRAGVGGDRGGVCDDCAVGVGMGVA